MSFNFYTNALTNDMIVTKPSDWYNGIEQAFICSQWENTTSLREIQEQNVDWQEIDYFKDFTFSKEEVWVNTVVGQTSTGSKTGQDFLQIIFKNINHPKLQGRYYIIDNEYYISYFDNRIVDVDANLSVRRCNEWMRIIDPVNGSIYTIPAVVDYDMSAPSNRVSSAIITPNNHAVVKVQQNAMTDRLFKTNARFILGNRPFKITGMQNATNQFINNDLVSLMDIDLFLDEIWEQDDFENGVAYNGTYDYVLSTPHSVLNLTENSVGTMFVSVTLNGEPVNREIVYSTSNKDILLVNEQGEYTVVGEPNTSATITATILGNKNDFVTLEINVIDETQIVNDISLEPNFNSIKEKQTIEFKVYVISNGEQYVPEETVLTLSSEDSKYISYVQNNNEFILTCLKRKSTPIILSIAVSSTSPYYQLNKDFNVSLTSLLG